MCKAVIHYRERKFLSGIDVSEKAGKVSKTTNALDVRRLPTPLKTSERFLWWCYDFARFHPNFEVEHPGGGPGLFTSLPYPPTSREDLRLDDYLEYPNAKKALFRVPSCREGPIHLQKSMLSPGFEPRAYDTVVSVANHFTGWTIGTDRSLPDTIPRWKRNFQTSHISLTGFRRNRSSLTDGTHWN
ncbi:hypothetical protein TNCV_3461511 [Trichonephila clavipes]|nr:hypothetical protein TNCV_3461511 [Trichonephila clavipes]